MYRHWHPRGCHWDVLPAFSVVYDTADEYFDEHTFQQRAASTCCHMCFICKLIQCIRGVRLPWRYGSMTLYASYWYRHRKGVTAPNGIRSATWPEVPPIPTSTHLLCPSTSALRRIYPCLLYTHLLPPQAHSSSSPSKPLTDNPLVQLRCTYRSHRVRPPLSLSVLQAPHIYRHIVHCQALLFWQSADLPTPVSLVFSLEGVCMTAEASRRPRRGGFVILARRTKDCYRCSRHCWWTEE